MSKQIDASIEFEQGRVTIAVEMPAGVTGDVMLAVGRALDNIAVMVEGAVKAAAQP